MDSVRNVMKRHGALMVAAVAMAVVLGAFGGEAFASPQCTAGGGVQTPGLCTISAAVTACPYVLALPAGENLLLTSTGSIKCDGPLAASGQNITISVPGGNMEMEAGSEITAENTTGGGNGGNIAITVSGNFLMHGTGVALPAPPGGGTLRCSQVAGACISSSDLDGGGGVAGNITIHVGNFPNTPPAPATPVGVFTMEPGSAVLANSTQGAGGAIVTTAGLAMDIDGLVRSFGGISGVTNQPPGGGTVTLKSGCQLVITPDGIVSSEGANPGADLVHLEGCEVTVNGLVRSIVVGNGGHALPVNPANHCNLDTVTHPAVNKFTACVEIWANNITINSILPNKGEVSADGVTDSTTDETRAWIDLLAKNNITINNDNIGPYSVHANTGPNQTEGDFGGLITIKVELGAFVVTGPANTQSFAVQANATGQSGNGGDVIIEAGANVELNAAVVQALGGLSGTNRLGGSIFGRSFNGVLTGNAPGALSANAFTPVLGVITLQGCGTPPNPADGVNYTGTSTPPATILADACGGNPTMPAAFLTALATLAPICAQAPDCVPPDGCRKTGRKFNSDDPSQGLAGWQICAFDSSGTLVGSCVTTTSPNGEYEFVFSNDQGICEEPLTFCEVLQPNSTQTFPTLPSADPRIVSCEGLVGPGAPPLPLGPVGYQETLGPNGVSENNDFGNTTDGECPKFPDLTADVTIVIDPGIPTQIQDAINALDVGKTLLILPHLGKKTESISINKRVKVVGCSITLTAATVGAPVVTIGAGAANGSTTDVHATGSTVAGYKLQGSSHLVKNVRSFDNAIGFWITGNSNHVHGALGTTGNGIGFKIDGNSNTLDTNNGVKKNLGDGVLITGDNNTVKKYTVRSNGGNGIKVEATANGTILSEDKAYTNALNGFQVLGTNTKLSKNIASDNAGCEFDVVAGNTNGKDNTANNVTILPNVLGPFPTGCIE